jgi:hypothetical protein
VKIPDLDPVLITGPPISATSFRKVASMAGTGTAPRDPSRPSSNLKTEEDPAPDPAGAPEVSTAPAPATGLATGQDTAAAAAVVVTATVPETGPATAAAAALTEPVAIGFPGIRAETWEVVVGGGGRGLGGNLHQPKMLPES